MLSEANSGDFETESWDGESFGMRGREQMRQHEKCASFSKNDNGLLVCPPGRTKDKKKKKIDKHEEPKT